MVDIFLSYAREDEARIRPLAAALEAQGWSVFWDRRIPAGASWRDHIAEALQTAACVVVVWSRHSVSSAWVIEEAEDGQHRGKLIPVLLEPVDPPIGFRGIQAADLTDWKPDRSTPQFAQLVQDVGSVLEAGPIPVSSGASAGREQATNRPPTNKQGQRAESSPRLRPRALFWILLILAAGGGYWAYRYERPPSPVSVDDIVERQSDADVPSLPVPEAEDGAQGGQGVVKVVDGSFQFDRITGMSMGANKITVSQFGSKVEIALDKIARIEFLDGGAVNIHYKAGQSEQAKFDCYWNTPVTFHGGGKNIYYGDCAALWVVQEIRFFP
jgi:hypothetical protein